MPQENPPAQNPLLKNPGTLWAKVKQQTEYALSCGALRPIVTECELVEQQGIPFVVRILSNLERKQQATQQQKQKRATMGQEFNPFLPYEPDLFVTDISETHLCLLNKYNAVDYHLLVVTRRFEEQENWLNEQDFEAIWACLAEIDGLAFYNAGQQAGASQRHKHLQLVPFPLAPKGLKIPIERAIASLGLEKITTLPQFPFVHVIAPLSVSESTSLSEAAQQLQACYYQLLQIVGLLANRVDSPRQTAPYNLLATRQWMLIVPRTRAEYRSIEVNSLGFAGTLLVRNPEQRLILQAVQPLTLLKEVAQSY